MVGRGLVGILVVWNDDMVKLKKQTEVDEGELSHWGTFYGKVVS